MLESKVVREKSPHAGICGSWSRDLVPGWSTERCCGGLENQFTGVTGISYWLVNGEYAGIGLSFQGGNFCLSALGLTGTDCACTPVCMWRPEVVFHCILGLSYSGWPALSLGEPPVFCPKALGLQSHAHTLYWCWVLNSDANAYSSQLSCLFTSSGVVLRGRQLSRWGAVKGSGWGGRACRLACLSTVRQQVL